MIFNYELAGHGLSSDRWWYAGGRTGNDFSTGYVMSNRQVMMHEPWPCDGDGGRWDGVMMLPAMEHLSINGQDEDGSRGRESWDAAGGWVNLRKEGARACLEGPRAHALS